MNETHPTYICDDEDHGPIDLQFQGWFGNPAFRRYICPACGCSYPEDNLKGRLGRDPKVVDVGVRSERSPESSARRIVTLGGEVIGEIEYVSNRRAAPEGSNTSTGYVTHWGWRPVGTRLRNLRTRGEAEQLVYEWSQK